MAAEFSKAVEFGLQLAKRIYYGKHDVVSTPPRTAEMTTEPESYLPTAVMAYAEIVDPSMVDNPDVPSYQPYVHGRCEPPVMIPLHMHGVSMEVDCCMDTAFVTVRGSWRVHCVASNKSCCCRIAVPMGEQGSVLGVEVDSPLKSYSTQSISLEDTKDAADVASSKDGFLIRGCIYTLKIPKKIEQEDTKIGFSYERVASKWSVTDFNFSYYVSSGDINGGLLLQSPSLNDCDQREMFCFYLYPGKSKSNKVFRKEVVFLVDISGSMEGSPLENVKSALLASLLKLDPGDAFDIIAFNGNSLLFSPSLVPATKDMVEKVSQWIELNFIAEGDTKISAPLNQAIKIFSKNGNSLPIIFLITDGAVEDERDICDAMRDYLMKGDLNTPRICTFGIGSYCNHYFLQRLAHVGRGCYDAAFGIGSVNLRMEIFISNASSVVLADLRIGALKHLDSLEVYPTHIPDLLSGCPLFITGRYSGDFPESVQVGGTLADLSNFEINVKVRNAKEIPIDRVFATRQVNALTAIAWFSESKRLQEKATELSLLTGVPSEYTSMILIETGKSKLPLESKIVPEETADAGGQTTTFLRSLGIGFGSIEATAENRPPGHTEPKLYETSEKIFKAASVCCGRMLDRCCCMCFLQFCNKLNDQCAVALTQLCTALACFGCIEMCCEVCDCDCDCGF